MSQAWSDREELEKRRIKAMADEEDLKAQRAKDNVRVKKEPNWAEKAGSKALQGSGAVLKKLILDK